MSSGVMTELAGSAAARFGDAPAFRVAGDEAVGFAELAARIERFAGGLAARGIGRGARVVLYLPNSIEWIVAYHAVAHVGAVIVPANILLTAEEVAWIAKNSEASAIVLPGERWTAITKAGCRPPLVVTLGMADEGSATEYATMMGGEPVPHAAISPDDLWTIAYTSGTTGRPKGAMLTHRALYDSAAGTATIHVRTRHDRVLSALPFAHVYGNIVMNAAFLAGSEVVLMPRFDAGEALRLIGEERITLFEGVPTMYYQMLAHPALATADFTSLDRCTVGGQTMPEASIAAIEAASGARLLELWGMSELAGPATSSSPYWRRRPGSVGLPFPGQEMRVVSVDDPSRTVADGAAGELCVRGSQVTTGYWRNPDATQVAVDGNGWLRTGDVAIRDVDGSLRIVDRIKDIIITGGYNIYPAEVEAVILQHPAVAMAAVAGRPDPEKGEIAVAFVVLNDTVTCYQDALIEHCRARLAAYKCPRSIVFVDSLPQTSTGKIMRRALAESPLCSRH